MPADIISESPINAYQLREELDKIKERDKELNFRAAKTEDYLNSVLTVKDADKLYKKIEELNVPRLREQHIHKIVELLPETPEDVKVILQGYTINVSQDSTKKIAQAVKEFVK